MKIKKNIRFCFVLIIITLSLNISGQNVEFTKNNFEGRKEDLRKALEEIEKGDELISKGNKKHYLAVDHYLKADEINSMSATNNYKIGMCYLNITMQKYKAISYLEKSFKLNPNVNADLLYQLGQAYQLNYEFDKAISKYESYKKLLKASYYDLIIDKKITECRTAKEMVKNPVNVMIENIGNVVNTKFPEYSPIINARETMMIFTSRRDLTTGKKIAAYDNKYYEDIYLTYYNQDSNKWTSPYNPEPPINTDLHDATVGMTPDGQMLLIYKTSQNGDIYESHIDSIGKLTKPSRLPSPINSSAHESVATFSPDGKTIYFCSNREGNTYGGHDIFMSRLNKKGEWSNAINLGKIINTEYDEESVFMMADGKTLYFSSNGHNNMGGFDIYKTVNENGEWTEPVNIGYPINTPDDEVHFSITSNGQHGYFASARSGGFGDLDIYRVTFLGVDKPLKYSYEEMIASIYITKPNESAAAISSVMGHIYDGFTKEPIKAKIIIKDNSGNIVDTLTSNPASGNYHSNLPTGKPYEIHVNADGYTPYTENIPKDKDVNKSIYLLKPLESPAITNGFVFDMETKQPVCKAELIIIDKKALVVRDNLYTDCNTGLYRSNLPRGREYVLNVTAEDYVPYSETVPEDINVNKIIYLIKIKAKGIIISGNVYDADTKEPVCAKLIIRDNETQNIADSIHNECKTGSYRSEVPKGIIYDIKVTSTGYIPYYESISANKDVNKNIYIQKGKPVLLSGNVYDYQTKQPVCSQIIIRDNENNKVVDDLKSDCTTGQYQSRLPRDKKYEINVIAEGYIPYFETIFAGRDVNKIIYIQKDKYISLSGNVYDAESKEPVCSELMVNEAETSINAANIESDCNTGMYQTKLLKGKPYIINVVSNNYIPYKETIPGDKNINKIIYLNKDKAITIDGNVYDADTKEPLCAKVIIKNNATKIRVDSLNTICISGQFKSELPKKTYYLIASATNYIPYFETIEASESVNRKIYLKKESVVTKGKVYDITTAKSFVLPNILYDLNKYNLKPQYRDSLNDLINTMKAYPNIVIELGSHTDVRASDQYNEILSYNRAKSVVDYLITKGIEPERLLAKGYGEKYPRRLQQNTTFLSCGKVYKFKEGTLLTEQYINSLTGGKCEMEAAHQLNRRTEFSILRDDYKSRETNKETKEVKIEVIKK